MKRSRQNWTVPYTSILEKIWKHLNTPNMENFERSGKLYHFILKSDLLPVRPLTAGGATTRLPY
jgi:hypothetical protein